MSGERFIQNSEETAFFVPSGRSEEKDEGGRVKDERGKE